MLGAPTRESIARNDADWSITVVKPHWSRCRTRSSCQVYAALSTRSISTDSCVQLLPSGEHVRAHHAAADVIGHTVLNESVIPTHERRPNHPGREEQGQCDPEGAGQRHANDRETIEDG